MVYDLRYIESWVSPLPYRVKRVPPFPFYIGVFGTSPLPLAPPTKTLSFSLGPPFPSSSTTTIPSIASLASECNS